jgi:ribosomal protein S18 acetylase RimI-like enzyme
VIFRPAAKASHALRDGRPLVVRPARGRDAERLVRLIDEVAAEPERPLLHVPGAISARDMRDRLEREGGDYHLFALAEAAGEVVGSLEARLMPGSAAHVSEVGLLVSRRYRGLGVGTALLDAAEAWSRRQGADKLVLSVFPHNTAALGFYERRGFVREGLRRGQFRRLGERLDEILMARFIGDEG